MLFNFNFHRIIFNEDWEFSIYPLRINVIYSYI